MQTFDITDLVSWLTEAAEAYDLDAVANRGDSVVVRAGSNMSLNAKRDGGLELLATIKRLQALA